MAFENLQNQLGAMQEAPAPVGMEEGMGAAPVAPAAPEPQINPNEIMDLAQFQGPMTVEEGGTPLDDPEGAKEELLDLLEMVRSKFGAFNNKKFIEQNEGSYTKQQIAKLFFELLEANGVDPSNLNEIRQYLDELKSTNEVEYALMEEIVNYLFSDVSDQADVINEDMPEESLIQQEDMQSEASLPQVSPDVIQDMEQMPPMM